MAKLFLFGYMLVVQSLLICLGVLYFKQTNILLEDPGVPIDFLSQIRTDWTVRPFTSIMHSISSD